MLKMICRLTLSWFQISLTAHRRKSNSVTSVFVKMYSSTTMFLTSREKLSTVSVIRFLTVRTYTILSIRWLKIQLTQALSSISRTALVSIGISRALRIIIRIGLFRTRAVTTLTSKTLRIWKPKTLRICLSKMQKLSIKKTRSFCRPKLSVKWSVYISSRMLIHTGWITLIIWISLSQVSDSVHTVSMTL